MVFVRHYGTTSVKIGRNIFVCFAIISKNSVMYKIKKKSCKYETYNSFAERQGFEPLVPARVQRFSRPPRSTTPAPLLGTRLYIEPFASAKLVIIFIIRQIKFIFFSLFLQFDYKIACQDMTILRLFCF